MASHNLEHKSPKRKRALGKAHPVSKADAPAIKKLLGRG
jgi:ribosomal protein L35